MVIVPAIELVPFAVNVDKPDGAEITPPLARLKLLTTRLASIIAKVPVLETVRLLPAAPVVPEPVKRKVPPDTVVVPT